MDRRTPFKRLVDRSRGVLPVLTALLLGAPAAALPQSEFWGPTDRARSAMMRAPTRVLVQFEREAIPKEEFLAALEDAKLAFLDRISVTDDRTLFDFEGEPFLAMTLGPDAIRELDASRSTVDVGGEPVRFRIEETLDLRPVGYRVPPTGPRPVQDVLHDLGKDGSDKSGEGWTIVVLDEGVDSASYAITVNSQVVDGAHVVGGAVCPAVVPSQADPTGGDVSQPNPYDLDHGTIVGAMACWSAPDADLVSLRVGNGDGAAVTDVIAALVEIGCKWRVKRPAIAGVVLAMANIEITEESYPAHHAAFSSAVERLLDEDVAMVVAAGNDGEFGQAAFPATVDNTFSVAMTKNGLDDRHSDSNWSHEIDLCAPGAEILIPVDDSIGPASYSGTSVSAPLVVGAVALLREQFPNCDVRTILQALVDTGDSLPVTEGGTTIALPLLRIDLAVEWLSANCGEVVTMESGFTSETPEPPTADESRQGCTDCGCQATQDS